MKRIMSLWGVIIVMGLPLTGTPAAAEDRPSMSTAAKASSSAKIGDEVTCALDGMKMTRRSDTPSAEFRGTVYYFCDDTEKQKFVKTPERYTEN